MSHAEFSQLVIDWLEWDKNNNRNSRVRRPSNGGGEEESEETGLLPYHGLQEACTGTVLGKVSEEQ